jgi:hypothetical protein
MKILKFVLPGIFLAILVLVFVLFKRSSDISLRSVSDSQSNIPGSLSISTFPKATGDIDATVSAIEAVSASESSLVKAEDQEVNQVQSDKNSYNDYLNAYSEKEI